MRGTYGSVIFLLLLLRQRMQVVLDSPAHCWEFQNLLCGVLVRVRQTKLEQMTYIDANDNLPVDDAEVNGPFPSLHRPCLSLRLIMAARGTG